MNDFTARQTYLPKDYQLRATKFFLGQGAAGLFLDPGLGKTAVTLMTLKILLKKKLMSKALILAPLQVVYGVWPEEIKKWEQFKGLRFSIIHGSPKQREKALNADADIFLINPEGLKWLENKKNWHFDVLVVDESSMFKNSQSGRFKIMRRLAPKFSRRYILTGTPAPNGLTNLFGQIYMLDLGNALGSYISHFRSKYCDPPGYGEFNWVIRKDQVVEIYKAIKPLILRMSAEDYLQLPGLKTTNIHVKLPAEAKQIYNNLEDYFIANVKAGEVIAKNAAVAAQKCRQVANGGLYVNKEVFGGPLEVTISRETQHLHTVKVEAVKNLVAELSGQPCLIAYEFQHDLERLKKVLGANTPHIGGGVEPADVRKICRAWNAGEIPVLLGQPMSMAHGLNLQGAGRAVIYHSLFWDLELYEQFYKRVWRQGVKGTVFIYNIVSDTLVDHTILNALKNKSTIQQALLGALSVKEKGFIDPCGELKLPLANKTTGTKHQ